MKGGWVVVAMIGMGVAREARAQGSDAVAAEAAFAEARALIRQGKYVEACPKLEASYALDPALGTLLNLGDCFERTGRTASAWLRFRDAAAMAVEKNQRERETIARERIAAVEPKLCRLVIRGSERPGLQVRRDGVVVAPAAMGLPVPVDPGSHVVDATAAGPSAFRAVVDVKAPTGGTSCPQTVVEIPATFDGERVAPPPPVPKPIDLGPLSTETQAPTEGPPPATWRTVHTLAVVAAASGLVSFGASAIFAIDASSTKSDADRQCSSAGCTADGKGLLADAGQSADVSTITFVLGAALLATGAVLWLTSPSLRAPVSRFATATGIRF